jgi:anti-anti-sigma factor
VSSGVETFRDGPIAVVRLSGEHDLSTVQALDEALTGAFSEDSNRVMLDLSTAEFIDSSVIGRLIRWSNEAQVSEREALAIVAGSPSSTVARTLALVRIVDRLPVFETADDARTALTEGMKPRDRRPYGWLSDLQLEAKRIETVADIQGSDSVEDRAEATERLGEIVREQQRRDNGAES